MPGDLFDLSGKVALVTGATRGIGRAIAEEMARHGARVALSSNEAQACASVAEELRREGLDVIGIPCDVAFREQAERLVAETIEAFGKIDILVCNAGVAPHMGPISTASDADWDLTMTVNLRSVLWLTSLVIPGMAARRDGSVIIISSIAGVRGNKAIGLYGLSKAANAQLARNLAVEWGPSNVRVNAISPGLIRTDFARPLLDDAKFLERRLALTPLRRAGTSREIAGVAVMLASAAGAFMTGQNVIVDGGTTIGDGS
ncbi:MAG: SDR family oxidoreductase [Pseudomonadota bacterium]|jgi:Dehydrogenases with different specificities (related to short-chain alcohol dehydrogenases)|nr:MAG: short-chain dehydrogenase [Pseudomonadota bacterium]